MRFSQLLLTIIVSGFIFSSCNGTDNTNDVCVAGSGGTMSIVSFAIHNGDTLKNYSFHPDSALLKFNAVDSPEVQLASYNMLSIGEAGENHIHSEDLRCGSYYVYRTAYDSAANKSYKGGMLVILPADGTEKDVYINVQ